MAQGQEFLMPAYYPRFSCKMGACRHACCEGWPISVSMEDYFRLLGVECSPDLRRKIDVALRLKSQRSPEAYAEISPRYDGNCPLRLEDGRCALHAELGGDVLSRVCKMYPRGVRNDESPECSCTNSCEAVLEMLFQQQEPLAFVRLPDEDHTPSQSRREIQEKTFGREQDIRLWLIRCLQQRQAPLPARIAALGGRLQALEAVLASRDEAALQRLLEASVPLNSHGQGHLEDGLAIMEELVAQLDQRSRSIHDYGERALSRFVQHGQEAYQEACRLLQERYPDWEIWFEHALVNHLFFSRFPFGESRLTLPDAYLGLCAVYGLMRFLTLGDAVWQKEDHALVDTLAAAFRLIDHTAFDRTAAALMRRMGRGDPARAEEILWL